MYAVCRTGYDEDGTSFIPGVSWRLICLEARLGLTWCQSMLIARLPIIRSETRSVSSFPTASSLDSTALIKRWYSRAHVIIIGSGSIDWGVWLQAQQGLADQAPGTSFAYLKPTRHELGIGGSL